MGIAPPSKLSVNAATHVVKEVTVVVMEATNVPLYPSKTRKQKLSAEISVSINFKSSTVTAPFMPADATGRVVIMKQFRFTGQDLSRGEFIFRIEDRRFGKIGEVFWTHKAESLTILDGKHTDIKLPFHFLTFNPTEQLGEEWQRGKHIKWNGQNCQLKIKAFVSRFRNRRRVHVPWSFPFSQFNPFHKPKREKDPVWTRWHIKDGRLEMVDMSEYPEGWSMWSMEPHHVPQLPLPKILDRQHTRRQAFAIPEVGEHEKMVNLLGDVVERPPDHPVSLAQAAAAATEAASRSSRKKANKMGTALENLIGHGRLYDSQLAKALNGVEQAAVRPLFMNTVFQANALDITLDGADVDVFQENIRNTLAREFEPKFEEAAKTPQITSFKPTRVPVGIRTRIEIFGEHLGDSAKDVVFLSICGISCLDSLQHYSPNNVECWVQPTMAAVGSLCLQTKSGGKNMQENVFEFYTETPEDTQRRLRTRRSASARQFYEKRPRPPPNLEEKELDALFADRLAAKKRMMRYMRDLKRIVRQHDPKLYREILNDERRFLQKYKKHTTFADDALKEAEEMYTNDIVFPVPGIQITHDPSLGLPGQDEADEPEEPEDSEDDDPLPAAHEESSTHLVTALVHADSQFSEDSPQHPDAMDSLVEASEKRQPPRSEQQEKTVEDGEEGEWTDSEGSSDDD